MRELTYELFENLTVLTSHKHAQALHAYMDQGFDALVLCMASVRRVDAAGVDLLLRLHGLLERRGATLRLCQVPPHLRRTLSRLHGFSFTDERPALQERNAA